MKKLTYEALRPAAAFSISALSLAVSMVAMAEEAGSQPAVQEIIVQTRLKDAAEDIITQRLESEVSVDILSSDLIGRIGDSNVAAALRRIPGVTTVDDKYVFVRGLGERYSKSLLNGAEVPSPDLSRSVLPLDLFPTTIVKSLVVQKGYSSDLPSQFGGGTVNIRTRGIPDEFLLSAQVGSGFHSESTGDFMSYNGGGDDRWGEDDGTRGLPSTLAQGLQTYRGDISVQGIRNAPGNSQMTTAEAQVINRQLATALFRDISIKDDSGDPDISGEVNLGNRWYFDNGFELGFIAGVNYDSEWRNAEITARDFSEPQEHVDFEDESTYSVNMTGQLGLGVRWENDHSIETTSLYLRNTDDKVNVVDVFGADGNNELSDGVADREYRFRYEQRELRVNQIHGEHTWGEGTRDLLGMDFLDKLSFADGLTLDWYFSDSNATTEIPSEVSIEALTNADPQTGQALSSSVKAAAKANYRFTHLDDELESSGFKLSYPMEIASYAIEVSGGSDYWQKARSYRQLQFALESDIAGGNPILDLGLSDIYSDSNINNDDLGFEIDVVGSNSDSYLAASKVTAYFGKLDVTWNDTIRVLVGGRYEEYQQVGLAWNPVAYYPDTPISMDPEELERAVFVTDDTFLSFSAAWMVENFWAETFQLRFSFAETTIRPDLRDISDSSYVDPLTGATVFGNPSLIPSSIDNYDLRAEWFFDNDDSFTITAFYKDILNPIEQFEVPASGNKQAVGVFNVESGEITGVEFEFLKHLSGLGKAFEPFFLQGNLVVLDHELSVGNAEAGSPTNETRGLTGASDYAANLLIGFDSNNGRHSATLSYNVFAERLYVAGRNGSPDSFEQPFNSLDLTYSFYPNDNLTLKLKVQNLLDEDVVIEQKGVEVYNEPKGQAFSLNLKYQL